MSYNAKVFNVMIASPGDVEVERRLATEVINEWNASHSESNGVVLLSRGWDTHAIPEMGAHPQEIINKQVLEKADILIAIFWSKLGTETLNYDSGTVEEIERHVASGKIAMLYFSKKSLPQSHDHNQFEKLKKFKRLCQPKGLYYEYDDETKFKDVFRRHLGQRMNSMISDLRIQQDLPQDPHQSKSSKPGSGVSYNKEMIANLSLEEKILVKVLSIGDTVLLIDTLGIYAVWTQNKANKLCLNFNPSRAKREFVKWRDLANELEQDGFLTSESKQYLYGMDGMKSYSLTDKGFKLADVIDENILDEIPSEIQSK